MSPFRDDHSGDVILKDSPLTGALWAIWRYAGDPAALRAGYLALDRNFFGGPAPQLVGFHHQVDCHHPPGLPHTVGVLIGAPQDRPNQPIGIHRALWHQPAPV